MSADPLDDDFDSDYDDTYLAKCTKFHKMTFENDLKTKKEPLELQTKKLEEFTDGVSKIQQLVTFNTYEEKDPKI
ncbi:43_t:CDS:2 [Ambispora gerdemannii]|uniref:43_t:CDS:1 n=1 Tax=Ambispora gerdemannii TaxID=144530 RepID=A0A9N9GAU5_9GLOM|nr:43_t:CDS:2 [Ambispora gerdemannii]